MGGAAVGDESQQLRVQGDVAVIVQFADRDVQPAGEQAALAELRALRNRLLAVLQNHLDDPDPSVQFRAAKLSLEQHVVQSARLW